MHMFENAVSYARSLQALLIASTAPIASRQLSDLRTYAQDVPVSLPTLLAFQFGCAAATSSSGAINGVAVAYTQCLNPINAFTQLPGPQFASFANGTTHPITANLPGVAPTGGFIVLAVTPQYSVRYS